VERVDLAHWREVRGRTDGPTKQKTNIYPSTEGDYSKAPKKNPTKDKQKRGIGITTLGGKGNRTGRKSGISYLEGSK